MVGVPHRPLIPLYMKCHGRSSPSSSQTLIYEVLWSEFPIVPSYPHYPHPLPLPSECGANKIVKARLWPCLSGKRPQNFSGCSLFARTRSRPHRRQRPCRRRRKGKRESERETTDYEPSELDTSDWRPLRQQALRCQPASCSTVWDESALKKL